MVIDLVLTISKNVQDYIMLAFSIVAAFVTYLGNAGFVISAPVIGACIIIAINALIDYNKKPVSTPPST